MYKFSLKYDCLSITIRFRPRGCSEAVEAAYERKSASSLDQKLLKNLQETEYLDV